MVLELCNIVGWFDVSSTYYIINKNNINCKNKCLKVQNGITSDIHFTHR